MAHLIVHFPGDPGTLLRGGCLVTFETFALQSRCRLAQLVGSLLAAAERQPQRPRRRQDPPNATAEPPNWNAGSQDS